MKSQTHKQRLGREVNPLLGMEIAEVVTRPSLRSKLPDAKAMIAVAIREQSLRDDARVPNAGKRYR